VSNIEKLLGLSKKLTMLLEDPEPGCLTWHEAVHGILAQIADFAVSKVHCQVKEFMEAVGQVQNSTPTVPDEATVRLRVRLVLEEAFEVAEACYDKRPDHGAGVLGHLKRTTLDCLDSLKVDVDLPAAADGFADTDYVVEGSRIAFGIDGGPIAEEVHRANMTKLGGPIVNLKQMKPEGWKPPDIEGCLREQGWKR